MVDTLVVRGSTAMPISITGRSTSIADRRTASPFTAREGGSHPVATAAHPEARGRLTLTRRGRLLLVGLPVALGIASLILLGAFLTSYAQAGEGPAQSSPTISVTVGAGETLWGLASRHAPDRDPRDVVAEMVELNNLSSSVVQAGQSISIPARG